MSAPAASPSPLSAGQILGARFRLIEPIGRGGFGDVWRADELLPNGAPIRQVALKLLSPETDVSAWGEEAKLLASFSHPSLVTILAAGLLELGEETPAPFVAMEMLDGETLGAVLAREGIIPWRRVLAWAREVAAALDVIHARGVVHLDLKPSNLFLTRDGVLKVLDFGIARRAGAAVGPAGAPGCDDASVGTAQFLAEKGPPSSTGAPASAGRRGTRSVVGTPGFMAPEVIEQRAATPAADAYALAACIVELSTGKLPQDVPDRAPATGDASKRQAYWGEVRLATSTGRLRDLEEAGLPRGVAAICKRLLALDPAARGVAPGGLSATLEAAWERPFGIPDPPYLGLLAFGPELEGMLFGRDDDIARLGKELSQRSALVLQGVSGSGKSSLAMAGIVPFLARRDAAKGRSIRAVVVRPGTDPDRALAAALAAIDPALAEASPAEVAAHVEARSEGLVFVLDQLEELCTQSAPEARERFVAFVAELAAVPVASPLRLVGTLREDFTSELFAIEPLGDALRDALRFVGAPTAAAVREIVGQPARLAGASIEGLTEVAAEIQRELRAGDGRLPLVGLALAAWWKTREELPGGAVLRASAWAELGGVRAIFADLADGVFAALDPHAQLEARAALVELCRENLTRRSVARAELRAAAKDPAAFDRAARAFIEGGLVVEAGAPPVLEVVHEFLFTAWDRLDGWLTDAKASRRLAAALRDDARTWVDLGRPATRLPSAHEIALAGIALGEGALAGADAELVREWLAAQRSRALWGRVKAATVAAAVFAAIASGLAAWGKTVSEAQARADQAKHEAQEASLKMLDNQQRAAEAQRDADKSQKESERIAALARRQQEEFERLLGEADSEVKRSRVRCSVVENAPRIPLGRLPARRPALLLGAAVAVQQGAEEALTGPAQISV